jgi:transcription antitermination factor NusG
MSDRILSTLATYNGREISLDASGGDSREVAPQIIIPVSQTAKPDDRADDKTPQRALTPGEQVRIFQTPYMGELGRVIDLPAAPRRLPSGLMTYGALVEVASGGEPVFVALANLQQLS